MLLNKYWIAHGQRFITNRLSRCLLHSKSKANYEKERASDNNNNKKGHEGGFANYGRPYKHIVVPGKMTPRRAVPPNIQKPYYAITGTAREDAFEGPFERKSATSIKAMRESCALARKILDFAGTLVKVYISFFYKQNSF